MGRELEELSYEPRKVWGILGDEQRAQRPRALYRPACHDSAPMRN